MIRLFFNLCKYFKQISFENEINIFDEYMKNISKDALVCPFCGAKHALSTLGSYKRHLVTYDNNEVKDNIMTISRYICLSCGHTHAILPSVIVPYMTFSFKFTLSIIHDYLVNKFKSVDTMCEHYCIAISTFYRILKRFKEHKKLWLGLLKEKLVSDLNFLQNIISNTFTKVEAFIINFFNKTTLSFFQGTS